MRAGSVRVIVAASVAACLLVPGLGAGPALAEATGDVYVSSRSGILEVVTAPPSVLATVPGTESSGPLAIRPDGLELYAVAGERDIIRVNLESMAESPVTTLDSAVADLAVPRGGRLVAALPGEQRVATLDLQTGNTSLGSPLPGPVNLLAASADDNRVMAAAVGGTWAAVIDPATGATLTDVVTGQVRAIAVDGRNGIALIATAAPNQLIAIELEDVALVSTVTLPGEPSAIAIGNADVFIAIDTALYAVARTPAPHSGATPAPSTVRRWGILARPTGSLATSSDLTLAYALEADRVEAFHTADATIATSPVRAARTVILEAERAPVHLAPMPGAQPMSGQPENGAIEVGSSGSGGTDHAAGATGSSDDVPPPTDTLGAGWRIAGAMLLPAVLLVVLPLFAIGWLLVRRTAREDAEPVPAGAGPGSRLSARGDRLDR